MVGGPTRLAATSGGNTSGRGNGVSIVAAFKSTAGDGSERSSRLERSCGGLLETSIGSCGVGGRFLGVEERISFFFFERGG